MLNTKRGKPNAVFLSLWLSETILFVYSECAKRIQNGEFAKEFVADCNNGHKWLLEQREAINNPEIEKTGEKIRSMFSWIKSE